LVNLLLYKKYIKDIERVQYILEDQIFCVTDFNMT